jgi:hypothetical protein
MKLNSSLTPKFLKAFGLQSIHLSHDIFLNMFVEVGAEEHAEDAE